MRAAAAVLDLGARDGGAGGEEGEERNEDDGGYGAKHGLVLTLRSPPPLAVRCGA